MIRNPSTPPAWSWLSNSTISKFCHLSYMVIISHNFKALLSLLWLSHPTISNLTNLVGTKVVGKEEIDLREKHLLPWQNIWNRRQITEDIKEKLGNQEEVPHGGGISLIYLLFLISRPCDLRTALEKYFRFH